MKKLALIVALLTMVGIAQAAIIEEWSFTLDPWNVTVQAPEDATAPATGWWAEVYNITDDVSSGGNVGSVAGAFFPGPGYLGDPFSFTATELDSVAVRLYNASSVGAATYYIDSLAILLPDASDGVPPIAPVASDFTAQTWQAVPEPATIGLLLAGGLITMLARRQRA